MMRAFLALDISEEVKKNLGMFVASFQSQSEGVKWVDSKNYHVTLKFFGNIDEEKLLDPIEKIVEKNLASLKPTKLLCEGIGSFPTWDYPKVLWANLKGETQTLIDCQRNLEGAFEKLGFPKENREFKLHLTLARIKNLVRPAHWLKDLEGMPPKKFGSVLVDHLTLYKSQLTKAGSVYTALREFRFPTDP